MLQGLHDVLKLDTTKHIFVRQTVFPEDFPGVLRAEQHTPLMDEDGWWHRKTNLPDPDVKVIKDAAEAEVFHTKIKTGDVSGHTLNINE